jgi:hypothetical protein
MNRSVRVVGDDEQPHNYRCDRAEDDHSPLTSVPRRQQRTVFAHPSSEADLANLVFPDVTTDCPECQLVSHRAHIRESPRAITTGHNGTMTEAPQIGDLGPGTVRSKEATKRRIPLICRNRGHPLTVLVVAVPFVSQAHLIPDGRFHRCPCGLRSEEIPVSSSQT